MGERQSVVIRGGSKPDLFLYSHWKGGVLKYDVQTALAKNWRWADSIYLARIIFCQMVNGHEDNETGFGISASPIYGDYSDVIVDVNKQTVSIGNKSWSFTDYVSTDFEGLDEG